jgi:hypothetical protein
VGIHLGDLVRGDVEVEFEAAEIGGSGGSRLEEIGIEAGDGGEPVVVAGDGVDGLGDAFEREVELEFVIAHGAVGVDDVGRD